MKNNRCSLQYVGGSVCVEFDWSPIQGQIEIVDTSDEKLIARSARVCYGHGNEEIDEDATKKLIPHLLRCEHMKPFDFAHITWFMRMPIFVERQLRVYRTATILERSLRYCDPIEKKFLDQMDAYEADLYYRYESLRAKGEPKEYARRVLPLSAFTDVMYTISVRNLLHLLAERLTKYAQVETRLYAQAMFEDLELRFPLTAKTFKELNPDLIYEGSNNG